MNILDALALGWRYSKYRWRCVLNAPLPSPSKAKVPKLSVAVIAQDCLDELRGLVDNVADLAFEIVVVDGGSCDGSQDFCRQHPQVRLIERPWEGHFGRQKNAALEACQGDWILHLDCDERVGPRLKARLPALCGQAEVDFYRLPMYWLTAEQPARYVFSRKHFPSWVPRLFRNRPEFRYQEQDPVHVTFPRAVKERMVKCYGAHLFHYVFVWRSREQLEAKAARYERDHPGTEQTTDQYYRYWRHPFWELRCDEQPEPERGPKP